MNNTNYFQDKEIWRDVFGFEGEYIVSYNGIVMSLKTNKILAEEYDQNGYRIIKLKGKYYKIHRLVALAFLPNPNNLPQVNHIDENKWNNNVSNLEWVTASQNQRHSAHQKSCRIKQIDKDGNLIRIWPSIKQIERELGYFPNSIIRACKGKQQYAYNFRWEYADTSQEHNFSHL